MMDDLISRKALIEKLDEWCGSQTYLISEEVWKIIKNSPKAFDKEKVIEEIEYNKEISKKYITGLREYGHVEAFDEAVSIIKRGGIE